MRKNIRKILAVPAVLFTMAAQAIVSPSGLAHADSDTPGKRLEYGLNVIFGQYNNTSLFATGAGILADEMSEASKQSPSKNEAKTESGNREYDGEDDEDGHFPDDDSYIADRRRSHRDVRPMDPEREDALASDYWSNPRVNIKAREVTFGNAMSDRYPDEFPEITVKCNKRFTCIDKDDPSQPVSEDHVEATKNALQRAELGKRNNRHPHRAPSQ